MQKYLHLGNTGIARFIEIGDRQRETPTITGTLYFQYDSNDDKRSATMALLQENKPSSLRLFPGKVETVGQDDAKSQSFTITYSTISLLTELDLFRMLEKSGLAGKTEEWKSIRVNPTPERPVPLATGRGV